MKRELLAVAASALLSLTASAAIAADTGAPIQLAQQTLTPAQQRAVDTAVRSINAAIATGNPARINAAVRRAVDADPNLAGTIIGILAHQNPTVASTLAADAAKANPALAVAVFTAAANAVPDQTKEILAAVIEAAPGQQQSLTAAGGQLAALPGTPPSPPPPPAPPPAQPPAFTLVASPH